MRCPFCREDNDKVIDSRTAQDGAAIRRRRLCLSCNRRFTTYESVEKNALKVVKRDGVRVPYDRAKLRSGIEKACWKRPISAEQIDEMIAKIESLVESKFDAEVDSRFLGEAVMEQLRAVDEIAYIRFASVYRQFKDVQEFVKGLDAILKTEQS